MDALFIASDTVSETGYEQLSILVILWILLEAGGQLVLVKDMEKVIG